MNFEWCLCTNLVRLELLIVERLSYAQSRRLLLKQQMLPVMRRTAGPTYALHSAPATKRWQCLVAVYNGIEYVRFIAKDWYLNLPNFIHIGAGKIHL